MGIDPADHAERMDFTLSEGDPIAAMHGVRRGVGHSPTFDMHYGLELGVVLSGAMQRYSGDLRARKGPGGVWLSAMWEPHGYRVVEAPCEHVVLVIWPPLLANLDFPEAPGLVPMKLFTVAPGLRPSGSARTRPAILDMGRRMARLSAGKSPLAKVRLRLLILELLVLLVEDTGLLNSDAEPASYSRISPALDLVLGSGEFITNEDAAEACMMSRDSFIRLFRRLMGVSFARFALRHRISQAARHLIRTDAPMKAIARDWGFTDASHFHRVFVRHYGCTPLTYRESLGQPGRSSGRKSR